jgi:glycosyltransferase involved in cell wall biosynthesis
MKAGEIDSKTLTYSICVVNFNMASVIEKALLSVLNQIDSNYELLVIDDGSNDNSVKILQNLSERYELLRYISIERDRKRLLGETRNISIREAKGKYVILYIDADDFWDPYIKDFVKVFHNIKNYYGERLFLSGNQISMANREMLLEYGPYRNTFVEDRDLCHRLAAEGIYLPIKHKAFRVRMALPTKKKIYKAIWIKTWNHMLYDLRRNNNNKEYIFGCITAPLRTKKTPRGFITNLFRMILVFPVYFISKTKSPLLMPKNLSSHDDFVKYRENNSGSYVELMRKKGGSEDISFLSKESKNVFDI